MIIMCDTREQKNSHITNWFEEHGIQVVRSKLYVGDYTLATDQRICVDRKAGLSEVYSNIVHEHTRFRDELLRAESVGITLVVLIEEERISKLIDVAGWRNPRYAKWLHGDRRSKPPVSSEILFRMMWTMEENYHVRWKFAKKADMGRRIAEILGEKFDE